MNKQTGGVVIVFFGVVAVIMAVKGSWGAVWRALVPSSKAGLASNDLASFTFGPGGVSGAASSSSSGRPGSAPAPLPRAPGATVV